MNGRVHSRAGRGREKAQVCPSSWFLSPQKGSLCTGAGVTGWGSHPHPLRSLCQGPRAHPSPLPLPSSVPRAGKGEWLGGAFCQPAGGLGSTPSLPPTTAEAGALPDLGLSCLAPHPGPERGLTRRRRPPTWEAARPQALGGVKEATVPVSHTWSQPRHALTQPCAPPFPQIAPPGRVQHHKHTTSSPSAVLGHSAGFASLGCIHVWILGSWLLCAQN